MKKILKFFSAMYTTAGGRMHLFENERTFEPVGCFKDNDEQRALPLLLVNFRELGLDWNNLRQVVRRCAKVMYKKQQC